MLRWYSATTLETSSSSRERSKAMISRTARYWPPDRAVPLDVDDALAQSLGQGDRVGAVVAVHRDAATLGDETHDVVAGHRRTAAREVDHDVVEALDVDAAAVRRGARRARGLGDRRGHLFGVAAAQFAVQSLDDRQGRDLIRVDRHEERVAVL